MAVARARGKLKGKQPKLSDRQQKELRRMHDTGDYSISDLAELFSVSPRRCTGPSAGRRPPHSAEETPPLIAEGHTVVIELDEMWHYLKKVRTTLDLESLGPCFRAAGGLGMRGS